MAKYTKRHPEDAKKSLEEATKLAKANQRPGQTKEQTKLVAQGIQKGIEQYKKQHKAKIRELDKKLKAAVKAREEAKTLEPLAPDTPTQASSNWLPWSLLIISWLVFATFQFV